MATLPREAEADTRIGFRVPREFRKRVKLEAVRRGISIQDMFIEVMERELAENGKKNKPSKDSSS